jgi:hypothetical protein
MSRKRHQKPKFIETPSKPELVISSSEDIENTSTKAPISEDMPEFSEPQRYGTRTDTPEDDEDEYSSPVINEFTKRKSVYYSVTESEINMYSQLGWISTIFLTIYGILIGIASGCFIALQQNGIPNYAQALLKSTGWVTFIISFIFIGFTVVFIWMQAKNKKAWQSNK